MNGEHLGRQAKDTITGFEGLVVGYARYLRDCSFYLLAPPVGADGGHRDARWFDERWIVADLATPAVQFERAETPGKVDFPAAMLRAGYAMDRTLLLASHGELPELPWDDALPSDRVAGNDLARFFRDEAPQLKLIGEP